MKSKVKQILSVIMTICMLSTMIPLTAYGADVDFDDDATVTAEASEDTETDADIEVDEDTSTDDADVTVEEDEEEQTAESEEDEFTSDDAEEVFSDDESVVDVGDTLDGYNYSIVMVDCGRKYYSVDSLESIIDSASAAGMHYVMLGVGNDGLRFLLKDMSLEVNGTKYSSYAVTKAIHKGNEAYSNFDIDELTEHDMELIMKHAASKGVEIIPLINSPGHMDAILNAATTLTGTNCAYSFSKRTIDVTNAAATAFTQALLQKYISWFASKGCTMFNMGADEYGNDLNGPHFSDLQSGSGEGYKAYITYLNTVAKMIKNAGMTPMAFNDGIYYNQKTEYGEINKNIVVCYWSAGWSGYDVAPASWLSNKQGFKMVNTHGDWYWIVGGNKVTAENAKNFHVKSFPSKSSDGTIDNPSGAMFCIWSDVPDAETDAAVASEVASVISNFGTTLPNTDARKAHENVQIADETVPAITVNGTLENAGSTAVLSLSDDTEVCWTTSNKNVIMLTENTDKTAVSTHALTDSVIGNSVTAMVVGTGKATVTAETATGIQHTQEFTVNDGSNSGDTENNEIKLAVGEKNTRVQSGVNNADKVDEENYDSGIAKVTVVGADATDEILYEPVSVAISDLATRTSWTRTDYYYEVEGNHYPVYVKYQKSNRTYYYYGYSENDSYNDVQKIGKPMTYRNSTVQLERRNETDPTPASTTITFEGLMPGTTYYTVGDTEYTIIVSQKEVTEKRNLYFGQREVLSVDVPEDGSVSYAVTFGNAVNVSEDGTVTAGTLEGTATVVATVTNTKGDTYAIYTYEYNVTEEDLSKVTPLEIQYWITNSRLTGSDNNMALTINAADENVATENGVEISTKVAPRGIKDGRTEEYWQSKILDVTKGNSSTSGTELQTEKSGDDETLNGSAFSKVRYWHGEWQVYTTEWIKVDREQVTQKYIDDKNAEKIYKGDKNQLVAYYMEVIDISNANGNSELHVNAADWGTKGDGTSSWGYTPESKRCSVSVQVIYEDNSSNPVDTTADSLKSKTIVYGYWPGGRGLGTMIFNGQDAYEIYKVGAETGTMTSTTGSDNTVTVTDFNWANNEKTVWEGNATQSVSIGNPAHTPSYDDPYDNLAWNTSDHNKNNAILIKVYVRAKATKDTLTVHYINQTLNQEFYNYNISVLEGTTFDTKFKKSGNALIGNTVTNSNGQTQTVAYELSEMPQIAATYRFGNYNFVDAERSNDGKEVWLYYTFTNTHSFVMDYGLPLQIKAGDLGLSDTSWDKAEVVQPTYGSVEANSSEHILTYTPSEVLTTVDTFTVELTGRNANDEVSSVIHTIYIYPASTVYYEEGFAETSGFSAGSKGTVSQNTAILGKDINNYGYDGAYAATTSEDNEDKKNPSSEATSESKGHTATFTFTGTGVDIYANTTTDTGSLTIKIADASGIKQLAIVDTKMSGDQAKATTGYNVPVFSVTDLDHSTYTVTITHSMNNKPVKLDGFKVYNTLSDSNVYKNDDEYSPSFLEVRDLQFGTVVDASEYGTDGRKVYAVGEQVYKDLTKDGTVASAMITVNDQISAADQKALYENGPKNEVYLAKNASLTLSFKTAREVQLGLKGVNGNTTCSITKIGTKEVSTTDMFYTIKNKGVEGVQTITIQNTGDHILSITKLKVCDDPNALQPLSVDSVVSALYAAGLKDPEQPTATPTPTVTATAAPTQKPVQQIKLATPKLGKVVSAGYNALKLNWSKVNGADGYRVYVKVNGQWKALGNTKSTTYVHKKLETGKSYTYTVKAYKNTKSGTVWSSYDKKGITGKAALSAPSLRKAKRTSAKKATLSWKKVNGASGYVVYRKTNNGRWQIVKKITKGNITSFTDKKLSKGKKYTYTVRAYRTVGKKNIYSGYNKKGLKVK